MPTKTKKRPAKKKAAASSRAKKVVKKSVAAKKAPAKKAPAKKKTPAKKVAKKSAKKGPAAKKGVAQKSAKKSAKKKASAAKKIVAKKVAPKKSAPKKRSAPRPKVVAKPKTTPKAPKAPTEAETTPDGHAFGTIEQTEHFSAAPQRVYDALTNGKLHAAFTGAEARITPKKGGEFHAWRGHLQGKFIELTPGEKIVQTWRSKDFPAGYPDSHLEIVLVPESGGTRLELKQTRVPYKKVEEYHSDWSTLYWTRLRAWLATHAE